MTASGLSSTLTTFSAFSLEGEKRGVGTEQRMICAEEQPLTGDGTTETIRGLDVILCLDTLLSLLPSRTRARRNTLSAGLQRLCQVPASVSAAVTPSIVLAVSRTHCQYVGLFSSANWFFQVYFYVICCKTVPCGSQWTQREQSRLHWCLSPGAGGLSLCSSM